ncbi:MAG: DUF421 domain-containing protein [Clostridia bacterium]|nr:DUF421 domain-containing protein [Clostridia bacterium]
MATVFVRTIIIYILFMLIIRLMGKRQVGELQLSELVTTFMLSELAVNPIQDISIPLSYAVIPLLFLLSAEVVLSFLMTKSPTIKKIFYGSPSFIIKNGKLNQKELGRLRIGASELISELRLIGFPDISKVEYAILEQNGKLSAFAKAEEQVVTCKDLKIKKAEEGVAHPIIIDGKFNESNLDAVGKNQEWARKYLKKHKLDIKDVFLLTCDNQGKLNLIMKDEK